QGVAPTARVPLPADSLVVQAVADGRRVSWVGRAVGVEGVVVVDRLEELIGGRARPERRLRGLSGVDDKVVAVGGEEVIRGQVAVDQGSAVGVQLRDEARAAGRQGLVPLRGSGGDEELVIEERAAESRVEEV